MITPDSEQTDVDHRAAARAWLAADPDDDTRAELDALLAHDDLPALADRFGDRLHFGTAGLRGELGAGPNRMNRVVVRQAAAGLMRTLPPGATVIVGFDARHKSDVFAHDSAAIVAAHGGQAIVLPGPLPTPVLAFAVRHLRADAGVMVTASHNPRQDNGYKVYRSDGAQLIPPYDHQIESAIAAAALPARALPVPADGGHVVHHAGDIVGAYLDAVLAGARPDAGMAKLSIVYTPLHGVGRDVMLRALVRLGCSPRVVPSQGDPDPDFPSVAFPNPEEPGAIDAALALAREIGADVVLANDPDADRLAVAVPRGGQWRPLSGDEVGALLGEHLLSGTTGPDRLVATTVVSSSLLGKLARAHGARSAETLTGFKWLVRAALDDPSAQFVFGYEEALGYAVNDVVRDKDGITAAVEFVRLLAALRAQGSSVDRMLDQLAERHGRHLTAHAAIRFDGDGAPARLASRMAELRANPPATIGNHRVVTVTDFLAGSRGLPPADILRLDLEDGSRVQLRPSGTEPKLKAYIEIVARADSPTATADLDQLVAATQQLVAP